MTDKDANHSIRNCSQLNLHVHSKLKCVQLVLSKDEDEIFNIINNKGSLFY